MRTALAVSVAFLILSLGHGSVSAQTVEPWRWLFSLHMFDERTGWAVVAEGQAGSWPKGAVGSVVHTTDGGRHWKDITPHAPSGKHFFQGVRSVHALSSISAWTAERLYDSDFNYAFTVAIFHTDNGGQTWTSTTTSLEGLMDFINARDGWLVAGEDVYRSTNGGTTWTKVGSAKFPRYPTSITFLNATTGWITGQTADENSRQTYLFVTRDGGQTWQRKNLPRPPRLFNDAFRRQSAPSFEPALSPKSFTAQSGILPVLYSTAQDAGVFFCVTHDGGATWSSMAPVSLAGDDYGSGWKMINYRASSFSDANHGWVTDGQALYVTIDGGRRWTKRLSSPPFNRPIGGLEFISPRVGWATGQHIEKPFLLKTMDGGRTWTLVPYTILRQ